MEATSSASATGRCSRERRVPLGSRVTENAEPVANIRRLLAEVLVYPKSEAHRLTLRWHGSDEALPVVEVVAGVAGV